MTIQISYSSSNDGQWGAATDEQAVTLAENCTALAVAYAERHWPDANINGYRRDQPVLRAITVYNADGLDNDEVKAQIDDYMAHHWVEEPLWRDAFDAHAYLDSHPK